MDSRWYRRQAIFIFIFAWSKPILGEDPCLTQQVLPDMDQRGINSSLGQSRHLIDDHFNIPTGGQWFRVESQHMLNDVSLIHEFKACGTVFPIYLKGSLPSIGDGVVDRIACTVGFGSECQYSMNIKIKMCGGYSVYFLQRPDSTSSAYCFLYPDKSFPKKLDIPKPAVNVSLVEKVSPRFHMNVQSLEFACNFVLLAEDVEYEVTWYIDGEAGEAINETKIANGTDIESLVLEEGIGQLERLGVNVECAVRAIPTSGVPGNMSPRSDPFYAGVTASPSVTLHRDDPTAYIVVKPTVPIGCPTLYQDRCEVVVELILPETYSCSGSIGAMLPAGAQSCGKHIRHDEWDQEHKIYIAWLDDQTYSGHQDSYKVSLRTAVNMFNPIWSGVTLAEVNVRMDDNTNIWKGKECHAICDPHMKTFDGRYYENQNEGTFIFYENDDPNKKVQIQMKVTPCNPPHHVFCVCAIAARVGGDVFVIDRCPGEYRTIFEFRSCEDHILDVRKINEHNYKIYLPSGAYLDAQLMYYTGKDVMNLHMYPSAGDTFHTRGLCGTLNGRTDDDFTQPDGNITTDNNIFATSWRVTDDAENLITMSADNLENLGTWNTTENTQFCTCNGPSRNISCTRAAIATCVRQDESPVVKQNRCRERRSRSLRPVLELPNTPQTTMAGPPKQIWNETTARNYCETFLKGSASFQACAKQIPATDPSSSIDSCILDILATQTTMWASSARESLKSVCMKELKQNTTYQEAGDTPSIAQQIKEIACPNECNGHGLCNNGTCFCSTHFGAADCSIDMRAPPLIKGINIDTNGTCDLNICTAAIVEGDSFIDTVNLTCHNSFYEIHTDGTETLILSWTAPARYNTLMEVFCDLPAVQSDGFAYRWSIGINYDPYHQGGQATNLTVYDGTCQRVVENGDTRAVQMDDNYCFIHGHCVQEGSTDPSDPCGICQTSDHMSKFQWSRNGISDCHDNRTNISTSGLDNGKCKFMITCILFWYLLKKDE
ncbi:von Willebrand factor D and EGF domain-containing protein-like isoform X2 [Argopecten irradians]|uniref:von Willebrand factor D and EGF domain-containing protein-like isoform X2 n=1 Tax=Argopecten irradians TaxID=31199 RepID=UPI0037174500